MGEYCSGIRVWLERAVGEKIDGSHTIKPADNDIHTLAYALAIDSIVQYSGGRSSDFTTKDYIWAGTESMIKRRKVAEFNENIVIKPNRPPPDTEHEAIQSDDMPRDAFIVMSAAIL